MREDQRPDRKQPEDDAEDRFDDALDDLFGADEPGPEQGGEVVPPEPLPPPPQATVPDLIDVLEQRGHQLGDEHVIGPGNAPPPPSYGIEDLDPQRPGEASPSTYSAVEGQPATEEKPGRSWRRVACIGCATIAGIIFACLAALLVLGIIVDEDEGKPTAVGQFVDGVPVSTSTDATSSPTLDLPGQSLVESAIMGERQVANVEIEGEGGFGALDKPVPVGVAATLGDGWLLRIDSVDFDAEEEVLDVNQFNEPAPEGRRFVIATVTVTNDSGLAGVFSAGFRLRLLGLATNVIYLTFETEQFCGVVPSPFDEQEILPGASTSGNLCWIIDEQDVGRLALFSENYDAAELAIWFAVSDEAAVTSSEP